jgi:hypothetical protein
MKDYTVQVRITDALVSFGIKAETLEDAIDIGREKLKKLSLFDKDIEVIDSNEEVTGVY